MEIKKLEIVDDADNYTGAYYGEGASVKVSNTGIGCPYILK